MKRVSQRDDAILMDFATRKKVTTNNFISSFYCFGARITEEDLVGERVIDEPLPEFFGLFDAV